MKHYGDITQLSGYDLPIVDCIVGGSPCQDLSVAGNRAGLSGNRSGLFIEQIRIVKEMRERDVRSGRSGHLVRPRYLIWENVPGAFSSNNGEDFRIVLEEICKVAEGSASVPRPEKKWSSSGAIMGDGWSVAWRIHDAQFWGVPQRRKRISLVADFGGLSAPEILFERKGLSWNPEPSGEEGERTPERTERSSGEPVPFEGNGSRESHRGDGYGESGDPSFTLNSIERHGVAIGTDLYNGSVTGDTAASITANTGQSATHAGPSVMTDCENVCPPVLSDSHGIPHAVAYGFEPGVAKRLNTESRFTEERSPTLRADSGDNQTAVAYGISPFESNSMKSSNPHSGIYKAETSRTLDIAGGTPVCNQGGIAVVEKGALNKWDVQSKHIQREDGVAESLYAGECRYGGGESYVMQSSGSE